jgi:hypothetical protein
VCLLGAVDVSRTVASLIAAQAGDRQISAAMPATVVEALGYVAAALILALWAGAFGTELRRLGAL